MEQQPKKDTDFFRIFIHRSPAEEENNFAVQKAMLKKYQRFLFWFPFFFIVIIFMVIYLMYALLSVNPPLFILLFIATIILLREISTLVFSIRMRKNLMQPLEKIQEAVEEIAKGNYGYQIEREGTYMVSGLVESFNNMSKDLAKAEEDKQRYEANRKKLIAGISHDLKTPMTSIQGYIEAIQEGLAQSPEKLDMYLGIIHKNVNYTNTLIDDLFLFSKLDINQMKYNFADTPVAEYFEDIFIEKKIELAEQRVGVDYAITVPKDKIVPIDSRMMHRVVTNIVSNAVKYNRKDDKQIRFGLETWQAGGIHLSIADNGEGIPKEQLAKVFEVFYRGDASRNKDVGGTGLGLSIARQLVEAHGGRIWAESGQGEGTTINIVLQDNVEADSSYEKDSHH